MRRREPWDWQPIEIAAHVGCGIVAGLGLVVALLIFSGAVANWNATAPMTVQQIKEW